ncbi:transporter substrate-binding domain-containing protein [Streptomyces sp. NPDC058257]|uniref:transporter substrate-binding domain-containing protein n=1 Tax=Streptomyces sp. NPDC058257 TaxID=3346409 RepID=UPI0036E5995E
MSSMSSMSCASSRSFRARRPRFVTAACLLALSLTAACSDGGSANGSDASRPPGGTTKKSDAPPSILTGTVNIAVKKGQPGFSTRSEEEDDFAGFEAQLVEFLSSKLDFKAADWDVQSRDRENVLSDKSMDMVVATYSITDQRDKAVDFTAPYFKTYQGVLVRKDYTGIARLADVDGKRVCSVRGSTGDPDSEQDLKAKKAVRAALGQEVVAELRNSYKTCVKELINGNFEAVWTDKIILEGFAQDPRYADKVEVARNITVKNRQFYGIGLREGQTEDCHRLNAVLEDFLQTNWSLAFQTYFPKVTARASAFEQDYKPTDVEFRKLRKTSCGGE